MAVAGRRDLSRLRLVGVEGASWIDMFHRLKTARHTLIGMMT